MAKPKVSTLPPPLAAPSGPRRTRHPVSPELAATVREDDEAVAATKRTAESIANAAIAAAGAAVERANAIRDAGSRTILRQLGIENGRIVGTEGTGDATVLIVEEVPNG